MMQKLDKNVEKKLKAFYKDFFAMHDNNGVEIVVIGMMMFLMAIILWYPEPTHWIEAYGITWSYAERICFFSFVALWRYSQVYRFYNMKEYKRVNMFELLQHTPVTKTELKCFWTKKVVFMGVKMTGVLLLFHLIRAMIEWNQINAWNVILPLVFGFVIPVPIVSLIIWLKK